MSITSSAQLCACGADVGLAGGAGAERSAGRGSAHHDPLTDADHRAQTAARRRPVRSPLLRAGARPAGGRHLARDPRRSGHHLHRRHPPQPAAERDRRRRAVEASPLCPTTTRAAALLLPIERAQQAPTEQKTRSVTQSDRMHRLMRYSLVN